MVHIKKYICLKKGKRVTPKVFPGGLGVRTQRFHWLGQGSIPGRGTKILKTVQCCQKIRKKILKTNLKERNSFS